MTVGDAIKELQRLDPREELVTEYNKPVLHILSLMMPLHCSDAQKRRTVILTDNPFTKARK